MFGLRLTGELASDVTDASGTLLFDVAGRRWSEPLIDALQLDRSWFPDVAESPVTVGSWHGVPVAAGAGDQAAGALGVGVVRPGSASVVLGTSGVVLCATDVTGSIHRHACIRSATPLPGRWQAMAVMLSAAGSLAWLRDHVVGDVEIPTLIAEAGEWPPGSDGLPSSRTCPGERTPVR